MKYTSSNLKYFVDSLNSEDEDYDLLSTTVTNVWAFPMDPSKRVYLQAVRQDSCETNITETIELTDVGYVNQDVCLVMNY